MVDVLFEHHSNVDTLKKFCKGEMNPAKSVVFPNWMMRDWCMSHFHTFFSFLGIQIWKPRTQKHSLKQLNKTRSSEIFWKKQRSCWDMLCGKVRSPYGHVFERSILMKALEKRASCPLSETQRQCPTQEIWIDNRLCAAEWNCSKKLISAWNGIKMNQLRSVSLSMNTLSKRHQQHSASVQNFLK